MLIWIWFSIIFTPLNSINVLEACSPVDILFYCHKSSKEFCRRNLYSAIDGTEHKPNLQTQGILKKKMDSKLYGLYRPRSALARALYDKQRNDGHLRDFDKNEWYKVNMSRVTPEIHGKFVQLGPDEETKEFLANCIDKSSWVWTQIWYLFAKTILKRFWTITDINGWLGRGSMFVLSRAQVNQLAGDVGGSVVDVGAGDGEVGRRFSELFAERYATEISASMRVTLANKGYTILDASDWWQARKFSCVCMLNLLDRCSKPREMLRQARSCLTPDQGSPNTTDSDKPKYLLIALVLPYKPYVEVTSNHKPDELIPIEGDCFEEQVSSFVKYMSSEGFELKAWSRAPYLCEGDFTQSYYWLDDAIFLYSPTTEENDLN